MYRQNPRESDKEKNRIDSSIKVSLSEVSPIITETILAGGDITFSPNGTSMLPLLRQKKDRIVLSSCKTRPKKYDLPLYRRKDGKFVLHRIIGENSDGFVMCGDNQFVKEYGIKDEQIIAVVRGIYRGDKYIDCDDPKYRLYCKALPLRRGWLHIKPAYITAKTALRRLLIER